MAMTSKLSTVERTNYDEPTYQFVDKYNFNTLMVNQLTDNLSTGIIGTPGKVKVDNVELTSNITTDVGTGATLFLQLEEWTIFFNSDKTIVTVLALDSPVELVDNSGYIYLNIMGQIEVASQPYLSYQTDKVRILRFVRNSLGKYSFIIMPELCGTPKYIRSLSFIQPLLQVSDFSFLPIAATTSIKRVATKILTEGIGCLSNQDINVASLPDEDQVRIVVDGDQSNTESYDIDLFSGSAGKYRTKQLSLSFDGKLVAQTGAIEYLSFEEAITELPYEFFGAANNSVAGEYAPVLRLAYLVQSTDIADTDSVYILDLTKQSAVTRTPVWYTK